MSGGNLFRVMSAVCKTVTASSMRSYAIYLFIGFSLT